MTLATTHLANPAGSPSGTVVFLHGLLGNRANFRGFARKLVEARPELEAVLVDLREHGDSVGLEGEPTLANCAADVAGLPLASPLVGLVGHSFGGKVAMLAAANAARRVPHLVVLDSSPSPRDLRGSEAKRVIEMLRDGGARMPHGYPSREAFVDFVTTHGESRGIADWLAMSLAPAEGGRRVLRVDLDRIEALLDDYGRTDSWQGVTSAAKTTFVVGGRSNVVDATDLDRLHDLVRRGENVETVYIAEAGHWVHVDAPREVERVLASIG